MTYKILAIDPGASYATGDVARGYNAALAAIGHTILPYNLTKRIDDAAYYYKCKRRRDGLAGKASWAEVLTKAASDIVPFALYHDVDWVLAHSCMYLAPDALVLLRRAGKRVALLLTESPYDDEKQAKIAPWVDVVFTNERTSVDFLRRYNPNTHYLPHAYDPALAQQGPIPEGIPHYQVLFIGTLFEERIKLFSEVDWAGIDFAMYGSFGLLPSRHKLRRYIRGGIIPNHLAQQYYRAADIVLNPYRTSIGYGIGVEHISGAESLNPRALELAACGAFQISDYRAEVRETFGPNGFASLVPMYRESWELGDIVRGWLEWHEEREARARLLPAAVANHTYAARAAQLTATLAGHGVAPRDATATAAD